MKTLLDSKFYSIPYYNAVVWLTPSISAIMKQSFRSVSANALRSCMLVNCYEISFDSVHYICKKCTPKQIMLYQISLKLHKLLNVLDDYCSFEHVTILTNVICTSKQNFAVTPNLITIKSLKAKTYSLFTLT